MLRIICFILVLTPGCASYMSFIDGLNDRGVNSCLKYEGSMRAGGLAVGGSGFVQGVTATGGAQVEDCMDRFGLEARTEILIPASGVRILSGP